MSANLVTRRNPSSLLLSGLLMLLWLSAGSSGVYAEGCGSEWTEAVLDAPLGYDFSSACEKHEACYDTCGKFRLECDEAFYSDMKSVCDAKSSERRARLRRAQVYINQAARAPIYRIDTRTELLAKAAWEKAVALRMLAQIAACNTLAYTYYRGAKRLGSNAYCRAQEASMCCPQNVECVDEYECPDPEPPATAIGNDYGTGPTGDLSPAHTASLQAWIAGMSGVGQSSTPTTTGSVIWIGTDQSKFCRYTPENMTPVPIGGGTVTTNGGGPAVTNNGGTANGGGSNGGSSTGNGGTATTNGGTATTNGGGTSGGGTITSTPGNGANGGEDPKDTDDPEESTPEKIYVNIKATSTDVAAGAKAASISTMHVKLFPSAVANPTLPGSGVEKDTKTGAGDDPAQALTDSNGEATIGIAIGSFGLTKAEANDILVALNLDPTMTAVMTDAGQLIPGYTKPDEIFTIDGEKYWVFYVPESTATALAPDGTIEVVICIIKKPVGAQEYDAFEPPPPFSRLPGATISFGQAQGALQ